MVNIVLLLGSIFFGLILLVLGAFLLLKVKNKIVGILLMLAGLAFTLFPLVVLMFVITVPTRG
jgi:hypothetical protein